MSELLHFSHTQLSSIFSAFKKYKISIQKPNKKSLKKHLPFNFFVLSYLPYSFKI